MATGLSRAVAVGIKSKVGAAVLATLLATGGATGAVAAATHGAFGQQVKQQVESCKDALGTGAHRPARQVPMATRARPATRAPMASPAILASLPPRPPMATASPNWLCERSRCHAPQVQTAEARGTPARCQPHSQHGQHSAAPDGATGGEQRARSRMVTPFCADESRARRRVTVCRAAPRCGIPPAA